MELATVQPEARLNPGGAVLAVVLLLGVAAAGTGYAYAYGLGPFGDADKAKAEKAALAYAEKLLTPTLQATNSTATYELGSVYRDADLPELYVVEVEATIHIAGQTRLQIVKVEFDTKTGVASPIA